MGDGALVEMTPAEIRADLEAGTEAAAKRSKSPVLTGAELDHLSEIFCSNSRFTGSTSATRSCCPSTAAAARTSALA